MDYYDVGPEDALKYYRIGNTKDKKGIDYAAKIMGCAKQVDSGDILSGLNSVYPPPKN
jgi:hypothetical protein